MANLADAGFASFVQQRLPQVVARARQDLASVEPPELRSVVHRMAGTLSTYGVRDAAEALRSLESDLRAGLTDQEALRRIAGVLQMLDRASLA